MGGTKFWQMGDMSCYFADLVKSFFTRQRPFYLNIGQFGLLSTYFPAPTVSSTHFCDHNPKKIFSAMTFCLICFNNCTMYRSCILALPLQKMTMVMVTMMAMMMMLTVSCLCFLLLQIRGGREAVAAYWAGGDDDDDNDDDSGWWCVLGKGRRWICISSTFGSKPLFCWTFSSSALVFNQYGQPLRKMVNRSAMWSIGQLDGNLVDWRKVKNCTMLFNLSWVKS